MSDPAEERERPINNDRFRALIDGAYDGLFIIDPETGQIHAANATVCEWLGYRQAELRDRTIFDCQTTFSEPTEWQVFVQRVREEDGVQIENEIKTRTGSTIPVEGSVSVVSVDDTEYVVAIPRRTTPYDTKDGGESP